MSAIEVDTGATPLIVVTISALFSEDDFGGYLAAMTQVVARGEPYVLVIHVTMREPPPEWMERAYTDWVATHREALRTLALGTAFVFGAPLHRAVLGMVSLAQPAPSPHEVCSSLAEALAWAEQRLAEAGLEMPEHVRPRS